MSGAIPKGYIRPKNVEEVSLIGEPLDQKTQAVNENGLEKRVPALHKGWAEKRIFMKYIPPPYDENGVYPPGAREMWLESMEYLERDLKFLLSLPHHRFWSQVVHDRGVHECLESYLTNAPRGCDEEVLDSFAEPVVESLNHLVLLVYVRMATYKESKENHITPSVFGDLIYDHYIFDICKILDICELYGPTNPQLITKMIGNIFSNQERYYSDLSETIPSVSLAFGNIEEQLGVAESNLPVALSASHVQLAVEDIHDISVFLTDILSGLHMFLTCHPPACKYFHEVNFEITLSASYERIIPAMMDVLNEREAEPQEQLWITKLLKRIESSRILILRVFRLILEDKCFRLLKTDKASQLLVGESVEKFVQVISTCVGDKVFISDYCSLYPVVDDLEFFKQHGADVTGLEFIKDAVSTVMNEMGLSSDAKLTYKEETSKKEEIQPDESGMNGYAELGSTVPSDIELSSLISHVQDLLPELGEGFIQQCLRYYGYSTEAVINALLEGSLPESLVTLDRSAPLVEEPKPDPPPVPCDNVEKTSQQNDFMDRANIYNNDEFDVFSRKDVDTSRVHKGKKANKFMKYKMDDSDREKLKEIVRHYEETGGTSIYEDELKYEAETHRAWDYDDEYDDTYDDYDPGNLDVNPEDVKRKPGIIGAGRLNAPIEINLDDSEVSDEDKSDTEVKKDTEVKNEEAKRDEGGVRKRFYNQGGARPKQMGSTRGVQRITPNTSKSSKPKQSTPTPEREEPENQSKPENKSKEEERPKSNFVQFCENPEEVRRRAEQRRQDWEANRNRGYRGREYSGQENGTDNHNHSSRPKVSLSSNKNSGKGWRQGNSGDDNESRKFHGGKYKEDTNHGKAQSQHYRNKMMHKNEHKRQGAQAKFNRNN